MKYVFPVIFTVILGIAIILAAYQQRGYFAVGAEYMFPILLLVVLLKPRKDMK